MQSATFRSISMSNRDTTSCFFFVPCVKKPISAAGRRLLNAVLLLTKMRLWRCQRDLVHDHPRETHQWHVLQDRGVDPDARRVRCFQYLIIVANTACIPDKRGFGSAKFYALTTNFISVFAALSQTEGHPPPFQSTETVEAW